MTECAACGSGRRVPHFSKGGFQYFRCLRCALLSLSPVPEVDLVARIYDRGYFQGRQGKGGYSDYIADERFHRRNARTRLRQLEGVGCRPPGRLLELGSAAGFFLDEARKRSWIPRGVDISSWARETARARSGVEVFPSVEAALSDSPGGIDAAVALQVLEHTREPAVVLQALRGGLRRGGGLLIETWDSRAWIARAMGTGWQQVTPPSVIHLFNAPSLRALLGRCGFTLERIRAVSKTVSLGLVLGQVAEKIPALGWLGGLIQESRLRSFPLAYRLGDLISVTARAV